MTQPGGENEDTFETRMTNLKEKHFTILKHIPCTEAYSCHVKEKTYVVITTYMLL